MKWQIGSDEIAVEDVIGGDPDRLEAYLDVYARMFPTYDYYVPYMRYRGQRPADDDPRFVEHWWLINLNDIPVGIREFKYVPLRQCGISMGIALKPEVRKVNVGSMRLAQFLLKQSVERICEDATVGGNHLPWGMVTELQLPETADDPVLAYGRARLIETYHKYGFIDLNVDYVEPPFIKGQEQYFSSQMDAIVALPLKLGIFPVAGSDFDRADRYIVTQLVKAILVDHYGLAEADDLVQQILGSFRH